MCCKFTYPENASDKFCAQCGNKLVTQKLESKVYINFERIFNERLCELYRKDIIVPNLNSDIKDINEDCGIICNDGGVYSCDKVSFDKFQELFAKEIQTLKDLGAEPVLRFGAIEY